MEFSPRNDREMAMLVARIGGSSLEQIGQEFGLTRERVRQLLKKCGWENRSTAKEVGVVSFGFKGSENARKDFAAGLRLDRERKQRGREARLSHIRQLRQLREELGRNPTLGDLARLNGIPQAQRQIVLRWWMGRRPQTGKTHTPYRIAADRLWRVAGIPKPKRHRPSP